MAINYLLVLDQLEQEMNQTNITYSSPEVSFKYISQNVTNFMDAPDSEIILHNISL
jgi:hypothetical protein